MFQDVAGMLSIHTSTYMCIPNIHNTLFSIPSTKDVNDDDDDDSDKKINVTHNQCKHIFMVMIYCCAAYM